MADVHLIIQKRSAADLVLISKLTTITSVGSVSIITAKAGTSLYNIVLEHEIGYVIKPESTSEHTVVIEQLETDDLKLINFNTRKYVMTFL